MRKPNDIENGGGVTGSESINDEPESEEQKFALVEPDEVALEPATTDHKNTAQLNDYARIGPYIWFILLTTELITLTTLSSTVYMVYAGANPTVALCSDEYNTTTGCQELVAYRNGTSGCKPYINYQFYSINVEWELLCSDNALVKNSITYQMVGVLVGAFTFGQLSDLFGRKRILIVALLGVSLFSAVTANASNFVQFIFARIIAGFFTGGLSAVQGVFLIENIPKRHRMWINTIITWSPNFIIFPGIAYLCYTWRKLALFTTGNALCSSLLLSLAFESPRWMIQKGHVSQARNAIARIRKINLDHNDADEQHIEEILRREEQNHSVKHKSKGGKKYTFYHIVCTKDYLCWTLTLCFGVITATLVNYGLLFNIETLSGSLYWNAALYGIIRWTMNIFIGSADYFIASFGRKTIHLFAVTFITIAVSSIVGIYVLGDKEEHSVYIRYITVTVTAVSSQISLTKMMTTSELFPTAIRNVAISAVSICGRGGVALAPQLFKLASIQLILPYLVVVAICLVDLVLFQWLVPESKNKALENHLPPKHERLFHCVWKKKEYVKSSDSIALTGKPTKN